MSKTGMVPLSWTSILVGKSDFKQTLMLVMLIMVEQRASKVNTGCSVSV